MYQYRTRPYHAPLGRFTSRDWIDYGGGTNLYGYVGGKVTGSVDPWGLAPDPDLDISFPLYHGPATSAENFGGVTVSVSVSNLCDCDKEGQLRITLTYIMNFKDAQRGGGIYVNDPVNGVIGSPLPGRDDDSRPWPVYDRYYEYVREYETSLGKCGGGSGIIELYAQAKENVDAFEPRPTPDFDDLINPNGVGHSITVIWFYQCKNRCSDSCGNECEVEQPFSYSVFYNYDLNYDLSVIGRPSVFDEPPLHRY